MSTATPVAAGLPGGVWRSSAFRRVWVGQVVSEVGDWAARLAMSILVFAATGSALQSALVFSVSLLPALGPGQWLTVRTGRLPRRTVFLFTEFTRAAKPPPHPSPATYSTNTAPPASPPSSPCRSSPLGSPT